MRRARRRKVKIARDHQRQALLFLLPPRGGEHQLQPFLHGEFLLVIQMRVKEAEQLARGPVAQQRHRTHARASALLFKPAAGHAGRGRKPEGIRLVQAHGILAEGDGVAFAAKSRFALHAHKLIVPQFAFQPIAHAWQQFLEAHGIGCGGAQLRRNGRAPRHEIPVPSAIVIVLTTQIEGCEFQNHFTAPNIPKFPRKSGSRCPKGARACHRNARSLRRHPA